MAGPLTIGEAASHLRRAQSVVSEIVSHLERQGLLERENDPADRRRTLIWLTPAGQATLRRQREVLSEELLTSALRATARRPGRRAAGRAPCAHSIRNYDDCRRESAGEVMTTSATCESCGMPIETGRYCTHCTDETGQLQSFDQRFERMTAWQERRHPGTPREEIERQTLDYMATMPAWQDHPRVTSRTS